MNTEKIIDAAGRVRTRDDALRLAMSVRDAERERIALLVERADNTMMKQDKLAMHIRMIIP